jgi:hypothetical protein
VQRASALPRPLPRAIGEAEPAESTLLDLVRAVSDQTDDDGEVVAAVLRLLRSGRVRLVGSFRGYRF